ncbi:ABC transmembrane type-1 domain-containing protein [Hyphomicrobiales bacterium]|nr:ABC transmembrane type-1 domain-containing protein [Hyphomicrobiales bacterium]CAH1690029.1 ABC transmembrane type-1 domain-containing protein [Hyphomicrobiales bacterium]
MVTMSINTEAGRSIAGAAYGNTQMAKRRRLPAPLRERPYLAFIVPAVIYVAAFTLYPALYSVFISFTNLNFGYTDWHFVGFENYLLLLEWQYFPLVLSNTAIFVFGVSAIQICLGFAVALVLNQQLPLRRTVRSIAVLPWIVPSIVIALLFQQIFNGSRLGIANAVTAQFGLDTQIWLADRPAALAIMIGALVWRGLPLTIIILLGGLQSIPRDVYEAAVVDGASRSQAFFRITIPLMKPVLLINLIMVTSGNLNHLDIPYGLTGGGPSHQTEVLSVMLYTQGFQQLDAGFASTVATLMLVLNLAMTVLYVSILRSRQ